MFMQNMVNFSGIIPFNSAVYITYLPDEEPSRVIDTAKKLTDEGFDVVPHLPARTIRNNAELENFIGNLSEKSRL